jgi:4-aminobutyrate aminotransferase-like enzyme
MLVRSVVSAVSRQGEPASLVSPPLKVSVVLAASVSARSRSSLPMSPEEVSRSSACSDLVLLATVSVQMERKYLMPTYNADGVRFRPGFLLDGGEGNHVIDSNGKRYLDFGSGIAVSSLGYGLTPAMKPIIAQLLSIPHSSNLFHTAPPLLLAKELVEASSFDRVFFCNSGTEANEAALKFARRWALSRQGFTSPSEFPCLRSARTDLDTRCETHKGSCECWPQSVDRPKGTKTRVIAFKGGFHGRTMGALSVTHKPHIRHQFGPLVPDVSFCRYNDLDGES